MSYTKYVIGGIVERHGNTAPPCVRKQTKTDGCIYHPVVNGGSGSWPVHGGWMLLLNGGGGVQFTLVGQTAASPAPGTNHSSHK